MAQCKNPVKFVVCKAPQMAIVADHNLPVGSVGECDTKIANDPDLRMYCGEVPTSGNIYLCDDCIRYYVW